MARCILALYRDAAQVDLTVWAGVQRSTGPRTVEGNAPVVASGTVSTRRFGTNLHVAVVTAKAEGTVIAPGTIHSYDVTIDNQNLLTLKLLEDEKADSRLPGVDWPREPSIADAGGRSAGFIAPGPA